MAQSKKKDETLENKQQQLPLLYNSPVPLTPERHKKFSVKEISNYLIAQNTSSIMLNAVEFSMAARHYPIVFAGQDENLIPVIVLGLKNDTNLFINEEGQWESNFYIPSYLRRYPFIFMENPNKDQLILCIDESSELLAESDVRPLFDGEGNRSSLTEEALRFCSAFQNEYEKTKKFVKELVDRDLLIPHHANIQTKDNQKFSVGGFKVIDEKKFNELPDDVILEWRKLGYIGLVYCHLISMGNWHNLVTRAMEGSSEKSSDKKDKKDKKELLN